MKKIQKLGILSLMLLTLSIGVSLSAKSEHNQIIQQINEVECNYGQCHAIAKSTGKRCLHCVSNKGDRNCWQH